MKIPQDFNPGFYLIEKHFVQMTISSFLIYMLVCFS